MICCEALELAVQNGFLMVDEEYMLPQRKLTDISPDAEAGNVETGEKYDPNDFYLTMAISFCPFCGFRLVQPKPIGFDPFELEDLCDSED